MGIDDLKELLIQSKGPDIFNTGSFIELDKSNVLNLLHILEDEINNFSYDDNNDLTYIFLLLNLLSLSDNDKDLEKIISKRLRQIHLEIKKIIKYRPNKLDKNAKGRYEVLKNIINKLEDVMLRIMYSPTSDYDKTKSKFITYLIFEYKNYDLVETVVKSYPYVVNLRNDSRTVLEDVVSAYLKYLKIYLDKSCEKGLEDLVYYKDIFKLLINNEKLTITSSTKKSIIKEIKTFINESDYRFKHVKEKYIYFINYLYLSIEEEKEAYEDLEYEYNIETDFNPAVFSEANYHIQKKENFIVSNSDKIISFDDESTIDIDDMDDAFSIKVDGNIYRLGVHIADPTDLIENTILIGEEAFKRSRSIYYENKCIPMFPRRLTTLKYALVEGTNRLTVNYYFYFNISTGSLIDFKITNEPVRIYKNSTYNEFDDAVYKGKGEKDVNQIIYNLCELSPSLEKHFKRDAIFKDINKINDRDMGIKVVSNCMIITNYLGTKQFVDKNLPFMFRNHVLTNEKIETLKNLKERLILLNDDNIDYSKILINEYPKAFFDYVNMGHSGLNLPCYGQITSPLRRYGDNIAVMGIKKFLLGSYTEKDIIDYLELVKKTCIALNSRANYTSKYEKAMIKKLAA